MSPSVNLYNKNTYRHVLKGDDDRAGYVKTTNGTQTLKAADASNDRNVLIVVTVVEDFANGDGTQPTFAFGETASISKFGTTSVLTGAKAGQKFIMTGTNLSTKALIVTATARTGTTSTGAIQVRVATFPTLGSKLP